MVSFMNYVNSKVNNSIVDDLKNSFQLYKVIEKIFHKYLLVIGYL